MGTHDGRYFLLWRPKFEGIIEGFPPLKLITRTTRMYNKNNTNYGVFLDLVVEGVKYNQPN